MGTQRFRSRFTRSRFGTRIVRLVTPTLNGEGSVEAPRVPRRFTYLWIGAVVLVADQATKAWATNSLADGRVIELVWTLQLRLVSNTGASFSMGAGAGPYIGLLATAVAMGLLLWAPRLVATGAQFAVGLIVGGAVGNLADRVMRSRDGLLDGAVVDFVDLQWWPVFNVADAGIVIGAIVLVLVTRTQDEDVADAAQEARPGG